MFDDPQLTFLTRSWANGESCLPLVQRLRELGEDDHAAAMARLALRDPECRDREVLQSTLHEIAGSSDGWLEMLETFAASPSEERWEALMRFVPEDVWYQRLRDTTETLLSLGCDGNILFRCATKLGVHPGIFDLATSGTVDPAVIEERGAGSPARATWLGLAAQAAFARGDRFAVIRYLRDAAREESAPLAMASIAEIRHAADPELNAELDKVGVERW